MRSAVLRLLCCALLCRALLCCVCCAACAVLFRWPAVEGRVEELGQLVASGAVRSLKVVDSDGQHVLNLAVRHKQDAVVQVRGLLPLLVMLVMVLMLIDAAAPLCLLTVVILWCCWLQLLQSCH